MSLHRDITACGHLDIGDGTRCYWQGACACGWHSETLHGEKPAAYDNAEAARADYQEHVEAALGAAAYYTASVACKNCGSEHEESILIGTQVTSGTCSRCGTRMIEPSNDAWDESRARSRMWGF